MSDRTRNGVSTLPGRKTNSLRKTLGMAGKGMRITFIHVNQSNKGVNSAFSEEY